MEVGAEEDVLHICQKFMLSFKTALCLLEKFLGRFILGNLPWRKERIDGCSYELVFF